MSRLLALVLAAALLGCPKSVSTTVAGSDDRQMDQIGSRLEELRGRTDLGCGEWCALRPKACGLSSQACELSAQRPARTDFQTACIQAQEECARFNEACDRCSK